MESERHGHSQALEGELGEDMELIAKEKGLTGLVTEVQQTAAGWIYTDMDSGKFWLRLSPDEDLCGLWELRNDVVNDNGDGRSKHTWKKEPVWEKGTRFILIRNVGAFRASVHALGDARDNENFSEADLTADERKKFLRRAGYLVSKIGDGSHVWLENLPDIFPKSLKPVPILNSRAAIEVSGAGSFHIREVLEHLVDKECKLTPWHLAHLLEQSECGEGPFESKDDDA